MCSELASHALEQGQPDEAIRWATMILQEDRCNESGHRLLMRAYVDCGQRTQALRQYQRCQRFLSDELGVTPEPETTSLFYSILQPPQSPPVEPT